MASRPATGSARRTCSAGADPNWQTERDALLHVRFAVFVEEQQIPESIEVDALDPACTHAIAESGDSHGSSPIGTARLDSTGHIGRVAVLAAWRRRGVGTQLMAFLTDRVRENGLQRIELSAQIEAIPFYEALGYHATGGVYVEAGIDHRRMTLELPRTEPGTAG